MPLTGDACMPDDTEEPTGRAKGGKARAEILPPGRRSEIAKKAALARWGAKATHKGSFKDDFGIDVDCYVLDDEQKSAVISQRGMSDALGLRGTSGTALPQFLSGEKIAPSVGRELRDKLENPIVFQGPALGTSVAPMIVYGYDVTILIDICKAIIKAEAEGR